MKKMRNGKRGFTLLEIITVVAIIVIIAGAAVVGVTVTLQRANATSAYLEENNGRNFESEARNTIKHLTVNTVDWSPIPKYTPQNLAQEKWDEMLEFGWTVEELGGELKYRDSGWYIEALEDPSAAWDPTLHNNLTLDQYTEMKNQVSSYLKAGYTMEELGLTYGGPEGYSLNPQWNPGLHNGKPVPGTVITPDPSQAPKQTEGDDPEEVPIVEPVVEQKPVTDAPPLSTTTTGRRTNSWDGNYQDWIKFNTSYAAGKSKITLTYTFEGNVSSMSGNVTDSDKYTIKGNTLIVELDTSRDTWRFTENDKEVYFAFQGEGLSNVELVSVE